MAQRRMFAKRVIDSDEFLEMPLSTQAIYFHLAMRADDDGFINNPKRILRMLGGNEDELKVLIAKRYLIPFESGVVVIRHWKIHNFIRGDRYNPTDCAEKECLKLNADKTYEVGIPNVIPNDIPMVSTGKVRLGKDSIDNNNTPLPPLSEKLRQALNDFYEMRKKIRKPMTSRAKQLALNKLRSLSSDEDTQVKIIEQSILNGWQSFYELKGDNDGRYKGNRSKVTGDPRFRTIAECERVFGVGGGTAEEEDVPFA